MSPPAPPRLLAIALLATLPPGAAAAAAVGAARAAGDLVLAPCRIEQPARLQGYAAECGRLAVPENRAAPEGRQLELEVARIPAISRRKRADPLFLVAGGPGQSTIDFYASVAPVFARIGRERDLVLVDQRGTGRSRPLRCAFDDELLMRAGNAQLAAAARRCRDTLAGEADLRQFTTSVAVDDLEAVRRALGYARIDLYGISYGTRVVQHYAQRHRAATRAVILDGVVAPQTVLGPDMGIDAQAALQRILARCRASDTCRARFEDPAADYRALETGLGARPAVLELADPRSGARRTLGFTAQHLRAVVRLSSYSDAQAALLPLALHRARTDGDYTALGTLYLLAAREVAAELATGMQESVVCTEDLPFVAAARDDRELEGLRAVCGEWPRGVLDADLRTPFTSEAPALLLSGTDDPVTPPAEAELAANNFPDHLHVVLPGLGHGQLAAPCIDRLMAAFLDAGTARGLDAGCTRRLHPMPFFTSLAGPEP